MIKELKKMSSSNGNNIILFICPHCQNTFKKEIENQNKLGITTILIKSHDGGKNCPPFIVFVDQNGRHRGSQKIDNIETFSSINDQIVEKARHEIEEIEEALRFYHLKGPRKEGRGLEFKVANVLDRSYMSSKPYDQLISYLVDLQDGNLLGMFIIPKDTNFDGGLLIYGKYHGMIYTLFWRDQKSLINKKFDDIKMLANLTVERLLDLYDLSAYFI